MNIEIPISKVKYDSSENGAYAHGVAEVQDVLNALENAGVAITSSQFCKGDSVTLKDSVTATDLFFIGIIGVGEPRCEFGAGVVKSVVGNKALVAFDKGDLPLKVSMLEKIEEPSVDDVAIVWDSVQKFASVQKITNVISDPTDYKFQTHRSVYSDAVKCLSLRHYELFLEVANG